METNGVNIWQEHLAYLKAINPPNLLLQGGVMGQIFLLDVLEFICVSKN